MVKRIDSSSSRTQQILPREESDAVSSKSVNYLIFLCNVDSGTQRTGKCIDIGELASETHVS